MVKRILKDLTIERHSNNESIITIRIFSDVPYLDKNFLNDILDPPKKEDVDVSCDKNAMLNEMGKKIQIVTSKYDVELTSDMGEHDILLASLSKEIANDIEHSCYSAISPIIQKLVDEFGKSSEGELQEHLSNTIKLIDLMKSHLAYLPTLQQRDKVMFIILEDIKNYAILGDKFLKLENFTNFWKLKVGVASKATNTTTAKFEKLREIMRNL